MVAIGPAATSDPTVPGEWRKPLVMIDHDRGAM